MVDLDFNYTNSQLAAIATGQSIINTQVEELFHAARSLFDAQVKLPHINEEGNLVNHGANRHCSSIMEALVNAAIQLGLAMDRDEFDIIKWRYKFEGGRFISYEEWEATCKHLDNEIERLTHIVNKRKSKG